MAEPKPPPPADPKTEGGLKTPAQPASEPQETGMLGEGEPAPQPRDDRKGGMIGEG
jgi:hypothetical protein